MNGPYFWREFLFKFHGLPEGFESWRSLFEGYFLEWSVMHPFITRSSIWSIYQVLLTRIIEAHSLCMGIQVSHFKTFHLFPIFQYQSLDFAPENRQEISQKSTSKCRKWLKRLRVFPVSIECFKRRSQNTHRCYRVIQGFWYWKIPGIPVNVLQAAFGGCLFGLQKEVVFSNEKKGHLGSR